MSTAIFDTLKFVRRLINADILREQAETLIDPLGGVD
jgi:hypothetical protein